MQITWILLGVQTRKWNWASDRGVGALSRQIGEGYAMDQSWRSSCRSVPPHGPSHGHPGWTWSQSAVPWALLTSHQGALGWAFCLWPLVAVAGVAVTEFQCPGVLVERLTPVRTSPHRSFPWVPSTLASPWSLFTSSQTIFPMQSV